MNIPQIAPIGQPHRISSDKVWPLRDVNGKTWAERRRDQEKKDD